MRDGFCVTEEQANRRFKLVKKNAGPGQIMTALQDCGFPVESKRAPDGLEASACLYLRRGTKMEEEKQSPGPEQEADTLGDIVEACADAANLRDCIIEQARQVTPCTPQTYLIADEGCQGCEEARAMLERHIGEGAVKVLPSTDPLAAQMCANLEVDAVPALILADCQGEPLLQLQIFEGDVEKEENQDVG